MNDEPLSKQIVDLLNDAIKKDKRIAELEHENRGLKGHIEQGVLYMDDAKQRIAQLEELAEACLQQEFTPTVLQEWAKELLKKGRK